MGTPLLLPTFPERLQCRRPAALPAPPLPRAGHYTTDALFAVDLRLRSFCVPPLGSLEDATTTAATEPLPLPDERHRAGPVEPPPLQALPGRSLNGIALSTVTGPDRSVPAAPASD